MSAGITSQYGFLYQRYIFIKTVLDNVGMDRFFVYEGKDDIDISETDRIMSVCVSNDTFVQVKSGTVTKDCWAKVLGNWLLIDDGNAAYKVVLENELPFEVDADDTVNEIYAYFIKGATKKSTSIANQVYRKFIVGKDDAEKNIKLLVSDLMARVFREVLPLDEVKSNIEDTFKRVYCQDIKIFEMAKTCRVERFVDYIQGEIDTSLEKKKSFTFRYQDFINIINRLTAEISDHKYTVDTTETRKRKKSEAEKLMTDDSIREVRQLKLVNDRSGFVVRELVKELLYKDFRRAYSEPSSTVISNMEDVAHTNFEDVLYTLPEDADAQQVFNETVKREIPSPIINDSPIYRNGCYVYLTGENVDSEKQITWGQENG